MTVLYLAVPVLVLAGLLIHSTSTLWGAVRRTEGRTSSAPAPKARPKAKPKPAAAAEGPPTLELRSFGADGQQTVRAELHLVA